MSLPADLLVLDGVNKHFGSHHTLKDIRLAVSRGEVVVVIGPSGSGKSTLCRTINRLEAFDSGEIWIDGKPLPQEGKSLARLRADVGMVFQSFNLFAHKTVLENVTLGPIKVRHHSRQEAETTAMRLLDRWGYPTNATSTRPTCRAGSNSGSRSPVPWRWSRKSCCSTNRPPPSTRR
jgi:glutamate transport system ATP-binding protein